MKAPFHHKFTYCLLAASLGLNVWLLHQTPSQQEPDSPPKTTTVLASQLSAEATKREEFQNGPPSGTSNATNAEAVQPHGGTVIKKFRRKTFCMDSCRNYHRCRKTPSRLIACGKSVPKNQPLKNGKCMFDCSCRRVNLWYCLGFPLGRVPFFLRLPLVSLASCRCRLRLAWLSWN